MMRRPVRLVLTWAAALVVSGHVGSPNVHFEGSAGPYPVRITIRPPGVVPGLAQITVRVEGDGVRQVTVRPVRWDAGLEGAPAPDAARPVPNAPGLYSAELWLMTGGSYSVHVVVAGAEGTGTAVVPVQSVAVRTLEMDRVLGTVLLGACALLFFGLLSLVGAAAREGALAPGEVPDRRRRRRARWVQGAAVVVLVVALTGGKRWWDAIDTGYRDNLYVPLAIETAARAVGAGRVLTLTIVDPTWIEGGWTPFVPDHGKLMHLFLVRDPGLDAFAHLHPTPVDSATFETPLPPLPAGRYRLYAGVVHESGFTQTLTDTVDVPRAPDTPDAARAAAPPAAAGAAPASPAADPDDAWRERVAGVAVPGPGGTSALDGGHTMHWRSEPEPLLAARETTLRFAVTGPDGAPAPLEPYLGMAGHAALTREDGAVFVHLHPMGTISAAARQRLTPGAPSRRPRNPFDAAAPAIHAAHPRDPGTVSFPYAFPRPGRYRIWVQVKLAGAVRTAVFAVEVGGDEATR